MTSNGVNTRTGSPRTQSSSQVALERSVARLKHLQLLPEARAKEDIRALERLPRRYTEAFEPTPSNLSAEDLVFVCRSMWNLRSKHLTTYTAVPFRWNGERLVVQHGDDILPSEKTPGQVLELDIVCLRNSLKILQRLVQRKIPVLLLCVVHASSVAQEERFAKFAAIAGMVPKKFRKKIIFEVVDVSDHRYSVDAVRLVNRLTPYARAVTASTNLDDRNFRFWKQCGFSGVGVNISRDRRGEEEIIHDLEEFAAQAKEHRLLTYLRELDKFSLTIAAISAGFDFVEGAAVGSLGDQDDPKLAEFNMENLYDGDPGEIDWLAY